MTLQPPNQAPKPTATTTLPCPIVSSHGEEGNGLPVIGLIGDNFCGKTTAALSFPGVFFFNFGNASTLQGHSSPVPHAQISKSSEMLAMAEYVKAHRMTEVVRQIAGFEDYTVKTIVVDATTDMSQMLDLEISSAAKLERDEWSVKLNIENKFINKLIEGTRYRKGLEQYYLVLISHFKPVYGDAGGKKGVLLEYRHDISGSFYRSIKGLYDICLEMRADQETTADGSGNAIRSKRPKHSVWSVPSHSLKTFIGDRFGGRGQSKGRFGKLPTEIQIPDGVGLFSLLEKHWHGEGGK